MEKLMIIDGFKTQVDSTGATINVVPRYVEVCTRIQIYIDSDEEKNRESY